MRNLKTIRGLLLLMLLVTLSNCEKDLYDEAIIQGSNQANIDSQTFTAEYIEGDEATDIGNVLSDLVPGSIISGRSVQNDDYIVQYDQVLKVIDNLGNKTYMFRVIHPDASASKFFNMVLQQKTDGNIYVRMLEYKMTTSFAIMYNAGEKQIKDFEGEYYNRLISHHLGMIDEGAFHEWDEYGGGSTGNGDTSPGPGSNGPVIPGTNNNNGPTPPNNSNPCPEGGGPISSGNTGPGGVGDGDGGIDDQSSCFILVGSTTKITNGTSCYYDLVAMYVECGGANRIAGKPNDGDDPCPPGNGVAILEPSNMQNLFISALASSNYPAHNEFIYLEPSVKEVVLNYLYGNPNQISINLAVSFFSSLYENGYTDWFSEQPIATQISILQFLVNNGFSQESQIFSFQAMDQMQADLIVDIQASFNSPFFVDTSTVSGNTPEEIKFREVYSMLQQSPKFKQLFNNLFDATFLMNAKFKIENIPQADPTGVQNGNCRLIQLGNGGLMNEISIHRPALLTQSNPTIAMIILHECIHAYLNVKLRHPNIGMAISEINNMEIQSCLNAYYNSSVSGQAQHSFFVDYMIPTMVEIFMDIKDLMLTPGQMFEVNYPTDGGAILYEPMGNPPYASSIQMQWNWQSYFTHLSFEGLQNTTEFPVIYPPNSHIDYIRHNYVITGNTIFSP